MMTFILLLVFLIAIWLVEKQLSNGSIKTEFLFVILKFIVIVVCFFIALFGKGAYYEIANPEPVEIFGLDDTWKSDDVFSRYLSRNSDGSYRYLVKNEENQWEMERTFGQVKIIQDNSIHSPVLYLYEKGYKRNMWTIASSSQREYVFYFPITND